MPDKRHRLMEEVHRKIIPTFSLHEVQDLPLAGPCPDPNHSV